MGILTTNYLKCTNLTKDYSPLIIITLTNQPEKDEHLPLFQKKKKHKKRLINDQTALQMRGNTKGLASLVFTEVQIKIKMRYHVICITLN